MVTIIREHLALQDGIPVRWWERYGLGPGETASGNSDSDPATNGEEYAADTNPTNTLSYFEDRVYAFTGTGIGYLATAPQTTNSRVYDVWCSSNLLEGSWVPLQKDVPGNADGSPVLLTITNTAAYRYYRVGVKVP
jgi:hypothetical protein